MYPFNMQDDTYSRGIKRAASEDESDQRLQKQTKNLSYFGLRKHPVTVIVGTGPSAEEFHCFAAVLQRSSSCFREELADIKAFDGAPVLQYTPKLHLPYEKAADFIRYYEWMDKDRLLNNNDEADATKPYDLARLFCFAERIDAKRLRNCCIDGLNLKTRITVSRIMKTEGGQGNSWNHDYLTSYYRAARWTASNTGCKPENSALYKFFTHFFAYFVLQVIPKLEIKAISELPTPFLWHILGEINTATRLHVPGAPDLSGYSGPAPTANNTTTTSTRTTDDGKRAIIVRINENMLGHAEANAATDTTTPAGGGLSSPSATDEPETTALKHLPKIDLITIILTQSAVLREYAEKERRKRKRPATVQNDDDDEDGGGEEEQPLSASRRRGRPPKARAQVPPQPQPRRGTSSTLAADDEGEAADDDGDDDEGKKKKKKKPAAFFGVKNLCAYHVHTSRERAEACARRYMAGSGGREVWGLLPILKG